MKKSLAIVRDAAKLACPVSMGNGKIKKTSMSIDSVPSGGNLRETIKSKYEFIQGVHRGKVYTNCEYAVYVEFGTGPTGDGTYPYPVNITYKADKWRVYIPNVGVRWISGQSAQPYLYPAVSDNKDLILKIFADCVLEEIKKLEV